MHVGDEETEPEQWLLLACDFSPCIGHLASAQQSTPGSAIAASPPIGLASKAAKRRSARSDLLMEAHDITHLVAGASRCGCDQTVFCIGPINFSREGIHRKKFASVLSKVCVGLSLEHAVKFGPKR